MPFDWVTFILVQNIGKPRSVKGQSQYMAITEKERREQMERNEINKRRVQAYLEGTKK